jgi:hypothetical protein
MFETINENSIKGKLDYTSEKFRVIFLLKFTKELIKHSKEDFFTLQHILKRREKPNTFKLNTKDEFEDYIPSLMYTEKRQSPKPIVVRETETPRAITFKPLPKSVQIQARQQKPPLRIPEYPLPPTVSYLRPTPTNIQIDLGRLNPLVQDPAVSSIECNGTEEPVMVKGNMGAKTTSITLNKDEINNILQKFSEESKIPIHEGVFKIVVGRLILSAIVSEVIGSKFIIRKMPPAPMQYGMPYY